MYIHIIYLFPFRIPIFLARELVLMGFESRQVTERKVSFLQPVYYSIFNAAKLRF